MIEILRQQSGDFYGDVQLVEAFCKLYHPNDCLVLIFLDDANEGLVMKLTASFDLESPPPVCTVYSGYVIYKVPKDLADRILTYANNDKWGIGSATFIWNTTTLIFCRD
jgi:hypothetical protein